MLTSEAFLKDLAAEMPLTATQISAAAMVNTLKHLQTTKKGSGLALTLTVVKGRASSSSSPLAIDDFVDVSISGFATNPDAVFG